MPWSGVELAEVAPWGSTPTTGATAGVVCGDYIVAFTPNFYPPSGALLPAGSFVSLHVPTQTARAYSGASNRTHTVGSAVAIGGYVYVTTLGPPTGSAGSAAASESGAGSVRPGAPATPSRAILGRASKHEREPRVAVTRRT